MNHSYSEQIIRSRRRLLSSPSPQKSPDAAEGGCGVLGFAANIPIAGRHVLSASRQMHNRGNGKGGGIAMVGLEPAQAGVDAGTLHTHYLLQVALLDPSARLEVEQACILPHFEIAQAYEIPHLEDHRAVPGLEVRPPDVWRYFVRVKPQALVQFAQAQSLVDMPEAALEDEFVYQNSFQLNQQFYASLGEKRAFVLSHGRNLSVLKIVGYAEEVVAYYRLEEQKAHVWIAHQRYPTKGRVWHPGGAHPFIGLNEALVHNGDFANYHAVSEYLRQRNIGQLYLTDTEVSVQLFDLWDRVYGYPLEITLEAMAPTSEHDFSMLPPEKQALYQAVQRVHMHGSPDGPWFFIVARSRPQEQAFELLGITDTSMLRPQVFALYENNNPSHQPVQIGLIASERQAINACLRSLAAEDKRFQPCADRYWVARGGSHTDGGAFRFCVRPEPAAAGGGYSLSCTNKFGASIRLPAAQNHMQPSQLDASQVSPDFCRELERQALHAFDNGGASSLYLWMKDRMARMSWDEIAGSLDWLRHFASQGADEWSFALHSLTLLHDRRYDTGDKKRASLLTLVQGGFQQLFALAPGFSGRTQVSHLTWESRHSLLPPQDLAAQRTPPTLILDALGFPPEGDECAARWLVRAYQQGWRQLYACNWRGGRFAGCGFGADSQTARLDLYGDVGDYAASGLDGTEVHIHGDGQDQLGQIMKRGKLVVHGDVGQTFLYGAKGGEIYVLGSAAGRPLINAVGRPRAVINGTCLDYLAESFMAGNPLQGGGFVILNGVTFDERGRLVELDTPYPGGNLFSLASGGAIYLRDPHARVDAEQLNGGMFGEVSLADWSLIEPYLRENERLFGISVQQLLSVDGRLRLPGEVYRKVMVRDPLVAQAGDRLPGAVIELLQETENR